MSKNYVLDTNVLLHDPRALRAFEENMINIPIYVIEEIDGFKREHSELGRNAREVARQLDVIRGKGRLVDGVTLETGAVLRVLFTQKRLDRNDVLERHKVDNLILATALDLKEKEPDRKTVLVTMDANLRIRADAFGLTAEDYRRDNVPASELYSGSREVNVSPETLDTFYRESSAPLPEGMNFYPNEYVTLRDEAQPKRTALARVSLQEGRLVPIRLYREGIWGIQARNREQKFALDALMRDDIHLVTLLGKAGTGKTLLALAAGLEKTTEEESFVRLLVSRPIFPLGKDVGFLPGDIDEKLNPWMQPIHDNLDMLLNVGGERTSARSYNELMANGLVQVEPLTYIRGRSIPHQYMIVDEAQNLTPHEVKTIITRAGVGTKVIFTGDPYQIDNPYVDQLNNGLTYLANRFKNEEISASLTLLKGERSDLAELAANLL